MAVLFNKVQRIWKSEPRYFDDPWQTFVRFIEILQERGAAFITFSEALAGDYDADAINIILDHHIDFYIVETEVMCRWERQRGVRSSVYLFNRFRYGHASPQQRNWDLTDLNIPFYQSLEHDGFEIGYHQNAVGQALLLAGEDRSWRRPKALTPEVEATAQRIFAEDFDALSEHFNIRTLIPHGAGENNAQMIRLPDGYEDRVTWVYNNAKRNGTAEQPLDFRNYSDSCGQRAQRFRDDGVTWVTHVDNLVTHAKLVGPGLNHVLIHPGRFGRGMPYELYDGVIDEARTDVENEFEWPDEPAMLPWRSTVAASEWAGSTSKRPRPSAFTASTNDAPCILTNNLHILRDRLSHDHEAIVTLLVPDRIRRKPEQEHKLEYRRRVSQPQPGEGIGIDSLADFRDAFLCFYNVLFARQAAEYVAECSYRFDEIHLHGLVVRRRRPMKLLRRMIASVHRPMTVYVATNRDIWESLSPMKKAVTVLTRPTDAGEDLDLEIFMTNGPGVEAWSDVTPWLGAEALNTTPHRYRPAERTTPRTPA